MGKLQDGSWRTAPLKEYPSQLCAWLAAGIAEAALRARGSPADGMALPAHSWSKFVAEIDVEMVCTSDVQVRR